MNQAASSDQTARLSLSLRRGLALPMRGAPAPVKPGAEPERIDVRHRGVLGVGEFPGLRPTLQVAEGDRVRQGQPLWVDKKNPALIGASPASGTVSAIHRGARRSLLSVVIEADERAEAIRLPPLKAAKRSRADKARQLLIEAGLWPVIRQRPYDRVPAADAQPEAILVTALDTRPLSAEPAPLIRLRAEDFIYGMDILAQIAGNKVFICHRAGEDIPAATAANVQQVAVSGPHPAGLPGILLHYLYPAAANRSVWYLGWQQVIAIGRLLRLGELPAHQYAALGGEGFSTPRVVRCPTGACISQLCDGELKPGDWRLISGSPLYGHRAEGPTDFLGRYHDQISVLAEGGHSRFMNWLRPGFNRYSRMPVFASAATGGKGGGLHFDTLQNGGERGLIPVEVYQDALPLELPVVHLLKALLVGDTERAQELGCVEFGPEDLSVSTYVCPSKYDYSAVLRAVLNRIEQEG